MMIMNHCDDEGNDCDDILSSKLCRGKAMVASTKPQLKKEESKRLRGERDRIKFIDLGF